MKGSRIISDTCRLTPIKTSIFESIKDKLADYYSMVWVINHGSEEEVKKIDTDKLNELKKELTKDLKLRIDIDKIIYIGTILELRPYIIKEIPKWNNARAERGIEYKCFTNSRSKDVVIHEDRYSSFNCLLQLVDKDIVYAFIKD